MNTLHTYTPQKSAILIKKLFKLERRGKYEEALEEVRDIWADKSASPNVERFEPRDAVEILLRCGSLFGALGHIRGLPGSQERSRDLLEEARRRFLDIYDVEKIAECENHIALSFWRAGEYNEGASYVEEALSHNLPDSNTTRLHTYIIKSMIAHALKMYVEILEIITPFEKEFLNCGDDCLVGDFYLNCGVARRNMGRPDLALQDYEQAKFYYRKAQQKSFLAAAYNNLAYLYKAEKRFAEALEAIDMAIQLLRQIKDRTREGFAYDSKALIYFDQGEYRLALETVETGIAILKKSPNTGYLAETYVTKAKVLIFMNDLSAATFSLLDAVSIARVQVDEKMAARFVEEFGEAYKAKHRAAPETGGDKETENRIDGELKLILPPSLAHYTDYQGVWINNSHLEKVGLPQGSLAVIVKDEIKSGDLIAIADKKTEEISCGFYELGFGIVCLEGAGSETQLFDENDIVILGPIVGVCNSQKDAEGKMIVEEIKIESARK
jgi:tetratricopeptide (TPR) repeat protein